MKFYKWIALIITVMACNAVADTKTKFNWGATSTKVTEKITKNNTVIILNYKISTEVTKAGHVVKQSDIVLISPKTPAGKEVERDKIIRAMQLPNLLVDSNGNPLEIIDFEDYIRRVSSYWGTEKASNLFQSPQVRKMLFATVQDKWCVWVCNWSELEIKGGKTKPKRTTMDYSGMMLPVTATTEMVTNWNGSNNIKITQTSIIGGEAAIREMTNFIQTFTQENNLPLKDGNNPSSQINELSKGIIVRAVLNPSNLKPVTVVSEELTKISSGNESKSVSEKHEYTFEWEN